MAKVIEKRYIPFIDAADMPDNVSDYCVEHEIQTHYQNDVAYVKDDGNPFAEWLKSIGYAEDFRLLYTGASCKSIIVAIQST